ncbi:hypothetical protein D1007_54388 [Hordeum vulgare]|nr:hypothetical protein D1007_54388 [Hordeum vulgare]
MALSAAGDVAILEPMEEEVVAAFPSALVGASWGWSCTVPEMAQTVGAVNWCPTPPRSPEREASPREKVLHASFQHAPAHQGPPAHLWTPPPYVDLVSDDDNDDTGDGDGNDGRATFFMLIMSKTRPFCGRENWAFINVYLINVLSF